MGGERHPRDRLRPELGLTDATLLCVASVIGSGIFLTPGEIAQRLPHAGLILAVWLAGGALSLAGALANAELGAMYPHAGGDYVYLREAFSPFAGFITGWVSFFAIFTGTVATLAAGLGEALGAFFDLGDDGKLLVALVATFAASWLNVWGVRDSARVNNAGAALKIVALGALVLLAPFASAGAAARIRVFAPGASAISWSAFGLALSPVLFSYLGWNATVYVASEVHDAQRNVPRSLFLGLAICIAVYLAVNAVYLYALPLDTLAASGNAGEAAARALFGPVSGKLLGLFVIGSILATLNATILVGPRIAYAMAIDDRFFRGVELVHTSYGTPHVAIWVQAGVAALLLVILRRFPSVLDFTTFAIVLATIADTVALYALRLRRPELRRPYRAWGYPWIPGLYVVANVAVAIALLVGNPLESLACLAVILSAVPFWLGFRSARS
ncbi:MAG TPA: APC family permease [Myxococcota bacterium]|nr:APC family permease [Myxococcota bacterium]